MDLNVLYSTLFYSLLMLHSTLCPTLHAVLYFGSVDASLSLNQSYGGTSGTVNERKELSSFVW